MIKRIIIIVALVLLVVSGQNVFGPVNLPVITEATTTQEENAAIPYLTEATITRIVDGDTVVIDTGEKVRLIGVNTPESTSKKERYGSEASEFTSKMLLNKTVYLEKNVSETDRYGRLLRIIWLEKPSEISETEIRSKMFNAVLVASGYAQPWTFPPDDLYSSYFVKFAREARETESGLWGIDSNGTTKGDNLEE